MLHIDICSFHTTNISFVLICMEKVAGRSNAPLGPNFTTIGCGRSPISGLITLVTSPKSPEVESNARVDVGGSELQSAYMLRDLTIRQDEEVVVRGRKLFRFRVARAEQLLGDMERLRLFAAS